ncbi:uncharacterized protein [Acropora muricata]|uniref:uncharacterized protein isoform X3 n=1 Tax=Acropora muricata TaxID=159855 RepID=UPI0034E3D27A
MEAVSRSLKKIMMGEEPKAPQGNDENSKGAKGSQALRILKEDKTDGETQPGGPSKENKERKTTGGESGHFDRGTQTRGNTEPAAKGSHDQRTPEEEKRSKVTQPGGSSKENQGRKTTDGDRDQLHSGTQTRDDTEPGREEEAEENTDESEREIKTSIKKTDKQEKNLSTDVLDIPGYVYRTVCIKLNSKDDYFFNDYRILCQALECDEAVARGLEQRTTSNPTDELLWDWSKRDADKATVEKLIDLLKDEDLKRMDVVKILECWVQKGPYSRLSARVMDIPRHIKGEICCKLNIEDSFYRGYWTLAQKLDYTRDDCEGLKQGKADPTDTLIKMWSKRDADKATVEKLIDLLKDEDLNRMDVVEILEGWVQKGPYSRLSTGVMGIPRDIKAEICCKLNIEDSFYRGYWTLAQKLDYTRDDCEGLKQGKADPTDTLIKMWSKRDADKATVEKLIDLLKDEDLNRMDVVEILEGWVQKGPYSRLSTGVMGIPRDIKAEICCKLNIEDSFHKDYRTLAQKLDYTRNDCEGFKQGKADPTDALIKMWCQKKGPLTVSTLIELLKEKRKDVVMILENWVNGLKACY